jgi:two-component system chemotaxis response regulator CheY
MKTILIVDDSQTTRSYIKASIDEMQDINIIEASTGFEALRLLPRYSFDLIISDINMPDINGFELLNYIKNDERYSKIPVVFVSTERSDEDVRKGLSLGASDYVTKPFTFDRMREVVQKALGL